MTRTDVPGPLLKWPGGKGGELDRILAAAPVGYGRYFEPFVGGGAVFFSVPREVPAFINDTSVELMAFYACVQSQCADFFSWLESIDAWWRALEVLTETQAAGLVASFVARGGAADLERQATRLMSGMLPTLEDTVPPAWAGSVEAFVSGAHRQVPRKLGRMRRVELERGRCLPLPDVWRNLEGAFKAACYTTLRSAYNDGRLTGDAPSPRQAALFFFLREYAYAAMFRFNRRGEFNVPYGGISYNRKDLAAKIRHLRSEQVVARLGSATLARADFATFLEAHDPGPDDFVFLDPPYDSDFSAYDHNRFDRGDHRRLAAAMRGLRATFQLVIRSTPPVREIYDHPDWHVVAFDKTYRWTIKDRNDRAATHLLITNHPPPD